MTKVNCNVESCSYNKQHECHANGIIISPKGGMDDQITCCGSFLDHARYENLANSSILQSSNEYVQCKVGDCRYYGHGECTLDHIQVEHHHQAQNSYTSTYCGSFEIR